jgi:signal transduction histidine kinase
LRRELRADTTGGAFGGRLLHPEAQDQTAPGADDERIATAYRRNVSTGEATRARVASWLGSGSAWSVVGLSVAVAGFQVMGTIGAANDQPERTDLDALAYVLLLVGPVALLARRRYPIAVLVVTLAATLAYFTQSYAYGPVVVSVVIAFFTTVTKGHRLAAWLLAGAGYAALIFLVPLGKAPASTWLHAAAVASWLVVVLVVSEIVRVARERAAETARAREEAARRLAGEERLRIARELHDVLAHNISLINVQAGTALHLMDDRPEQARTALTAIRDASKEALRELRSVLGVLRQVDEEPPRSPAPGLGELDELLTRAGSAGLDVHMEVDGTPRELPAEIERAAFRIAQEALTNVTRHAGDARATVRLDYGTDELTLQVVDDGVGVPVGAATGAGRGIAGMRERATALGGRLDAGPRPGGGFRVRAKLPLDGTP